MNIYVSIGTPTNREQEIFLKNLLEHLTAKKLNPIVYGVNKFSNQAPLPSILKIISESSGIIVVAYEKYFVEKGVELRAEDQKLPLDGKYLSTSWNHIESSMAFSKGIPSLVMIGKNIHPSGMLEFSSANHIFTFDVKEDIRTHSKVNLALEPWIEEVKAFESSRKIKSQRLDANAGIVELWNWFKLLKLNDQVKVVLGLLALFSAGVGFAPALPRIISLLK